MIRRFIAPVTFPMKSKLLFLVVICLAQQGAGGADRPPANLSADAYNIVKSAESFAIGGVGVAGVTSKTETAFRQLLKQPDPAVRCQKLVREATPAGQLYALLGLRLTDQKAFQALVPTFKTSTKDVETVTGCIVARTPVAVVATRIEAGKVK